MREEKTRIPKMYEKALEKQVITRLYVSRLSKKDKLKYGYTPSTDVLDKAIDKKTVDIIFDLHDFGLEEMYATNKELGFKSSPHRFANDVLAECKRFVEFMMEEDVLDRSTSYNVKLF